MLETIPLSELSIPVVSILVLLLIVKTFLKHLKEKDEKFSKIIENHINHSTVVNEKMIASNNNLFEVINRLINRLDN